MLNSTRTHRPQHSISKPMPAVHPLPVAPPTGPEAKTKARRPSVSSPMTWLVRTSSSTSTQSMPYAPSRPVRISEPRFANPVEAATLARSGVLGDGATVVRTPQDALAGPKASASSPNLVMRVRSPSPSNVHPGENGEHIHSNQRPGSPPLPPIPDSDSEYLEELEEDDAESTASYTITPMPVASHRPPPSRRPPSLPSIPDFSSELAPLSTSPLRPHKGALETLPPVPPIPTGVVTVPPQSPFSAILVSPVPNSSMDPTKIIVSLGTSTATHRTTMSTLISRPSHLASYLLELFPSAERDTQSVYSTSSGLDSTFNSIFQYHLSSSGVLSQAATNIEIFLDRPSSPYAHILAYLRSPQSTLELPATLPHGVRLGGHSSRLEALLELRDEAYYLGLEELQKLCMDEIRHRQRSPPSLGLGLHMRGFSNASSKSLQSTHTLRESTRPEPQAALRNSDDSGFASAGGGRKSGGSTELDVPWPSPPDLKERIALRERSCSPKDHFATLKPKSSGAWI